MKLSNILKQIIKENEKNSFENLELKDVIDNVKLLSNPQTYNIFIKCKNNIEKQINQNSINVWREMSNVTDDWIESIINGNQTISLGKYWAYDKDAAHSYWSENGYGTHSVMIGAKVFLNQVDWEYTFKSKIQNDPNDYEKEIGLLEGTYVDILYLEIDGDTIDISEIDIPQFKI